MLAMRVSQCVCSPQARINLGEESFVPDLIAYREHRVPADDDNEIPEDFFDPPDLAVEVMSPGQVLGTLRQRCRDMASLGVGAVLLILPRGANCRVFRAGTSPARSVGPTLSI